MANEVKTPIPARIYNAAVGGHVAGTEDIYDDTKSKTQKQINTEVEQSLGSGGSVDSRIQSAVNNEKSRAESVESSQAERITTLENAVGSGGSVDERIATEGAKHYLKSETYTKDEVHGLITTPNQQYITVTATNQTTAVTDILPASGEADTVYRVGNWDGSAYDDTVYSEYAWNGTAYVFLRKKDYGIDDEPTAGSNNLVESGGVGTIIDKINSGLYVSKETYDARIFTSANKKAINLEGQEITTSSDDWKHTDYLSVGEGDFVYAKVDNGGANTIAMIAIYSSNNESSFVRAISYCDGVSSAYIKSGEAYIRISSISPAASSIKIIGNDSLSSIEALDNQIYSNAGNLPIQYDNFVISDANTWAENSQYCTKLIKVNAGDVIETGAYGGEFFIGLIKKITIPKNGTAYTPATGFSRIRVPNGNRISITNTDGIFLAVCLNKTALTACSYIRINGNYNLNYVGKLNDNIIALNNNKAEKKELHVLYDTVDELPQHNLCLSDINTWLSADAWVHKVININPGDVVTVYSSALCFYQLIKDYNPEEGQSYSPSSSTPDRVRVDATYAISSTNTDGLYLILMVPSENPNCVTLSINYEEYKINKIKAVEREIAEIEEERVSQKEFKVKKLDLTNYNGGLDVSGPLYVTRFGKHSENDSYGCIFVTNTPEFNDNNVVALYYADRKIGNVSTSDNPKLSNGCILDAFVSDWGSNLKFVSVRINEELIIRQHDVSVINKCKTYDAVVIGAGSAGISAAIALNNSGYSVALIEKQSSIGGNQLNSWVNVNLASGDVPYLKTLTEKLINEGKAKYIKTDYLNFTPEQLANINYDDTLIEQRFMKSGHTEACVYYDINALKEEYISLLSNIDILTDKQFVSAEESDGVVKCIYIKDTNTGNIEKIFAGFFIDSSADDVLLRSISDEEGVDFFIGSDASNRYQTSHGFVESHAGSTSIRTGINYPTLMYRLKLGSENMDGVTAAFDNDAGPYGSVDDFIYVNSVAYLAGDFYKCDGVAALNDREGTRKLMEERTVQHWKTIKNGGSSRFTPWNFATKKYDSAAPQLGVRETYRANCERMLNENSFYTKISSSNIVAQNNLDCIIAVGCHIADSHGDTSIDAAAINANMQVYGVPYGCIVPVGLKNVLIASRGAGMTHIGASSFRGNKNVAMLGYAAGSAIKYMLDNNLSDSRNVNVQTLQGNSYTGFAALVERIEAIML